MSCSVYLLADDARPGWAKVGLADDVERRLQQHRTAAPSARIVASWCCPDRADARLMERQALEILGSERRIAARCDDQRSL